MLTCEELTEKIKSLPIGTIIPKPVSEKVWTIASWGKRRGEAALVYRIPTNNPAKYPDGHKKGVNFTEFYKAYEVLQEKSEFTREWFSENLPECAKEGRCNFTTIGGIFERIDIAQYDRSNQGCYKRV